MSNLDIKITRGVYSRDNHQFALSLRDPSPGCWVTWTAYGAKGSRGFARLFDGTEMHEICPFPGNDYAQVHPVCVSGPDGTGLAWFEKRGRAYVLCRCVTEGSGLAAREALQSCPSGARPAELRATVGADGSWWLVWAQPVLGSSSIEVMRASRDGEVRHWSLSAGSGPDYRPRLTVLPANGVYVAWDAYVDGSYSVYGCAFTAMGPGPVEPISQTPEWETRVSLCRGPDGQPWCCWVRCEDVIWRESVIHQKYAVRGAFLRDGQWLPLTDNDGQPDIAPLHYGLLTDFDRAPPALGHQGRRLHPMLKAVEDGSVWLLFETKADDAVQTTGSRGRLVGLRSVDGLWSESASVAEGLVYYELPENERLPTECCVVARDIDGDRPDHDVDELHLRTVQLTPGLPGLRPETRQVDLTHWDVVQLPITGLHDPAHQRTRLPGDAHNECELIWGDFHVHSVGSVECEGELDELAHYARDKARIHALTLSDNDHFWSHAARKNQRWLSDDEWDANVANAGVVNQPGRFAQFPGYEQTINAEHHTPAARLLHNHTSVMGDDDDMERELFQFREDIVEALAAGRRRSNKEIVDCVAWAATRGYYPLPHAHTNWWRIVDPAVQTACDVTSAWMLNFEEYDIHRTYLERGVRFGFTGSSDSHYRNPGFGGALTGLWVRELTRGGVLEALRARRVYATAGQRILVEFAVDGTFMGGVLVVNDDPLVRWRVEGHDDTGYELRLIRDGRVVHTERFRGACEGELRDERLMLFRAGQHYYYLEIIPEEGIPEYGSNAAHALGGRAWSSPVWVETADWIVS